MIAKTDTTPYQGHDNWYLAAFLGGILVLGVTAYFAHRHALANWERDLFVNINDWPSSLRVFFKAVSIAQSSLWIAVAAVVLAFVCRMWRLAWRLAATTIGGYAVALVLKHLIARPRPAGLLENVHLRWTDTGMGYPSGHVMIMTIVMLSVLPYLTWKTRWIVPLLIGLMMVSRVYLGLHAPLDVIGGMALGVIVVSFVRIMPQTLRVALRLD